MNKETLLFIVLKEYELRVKDKKRLAENYAQAGLTEYYEKTMKDLKEYEEILYVYYQIKAELGAWEVVKEYLVVEESRVDEDSYVDCIVIKDDCIHPLHSDLEGIHVDIIKKALEIKDAKN